MSKLKFNISPYFDDFAESSSFQRILFRPNFSIQARELNQLQTILQDQITKLSGQFYQNGDYVRPGELVYTNNISYITLSTDLTDAQIISLLYHHPGRALHIPAVCIRNCHRRQRLGTQELR